MGAVPVSAIRNTLRMLRKMRARCVSAEALRYYDGEIVKAERLIAEKEAVRHHAPAPRPTR